MNFNPIVVGGALTIIVGTVFGSSFFSYDAGPIPLTLDRALLGGLVLLFLGRCLFGKEQIRFFDRTDYIVLVLMGLMVFSTITNDWHYKDNMPLGRLLFFNVMPVGMYFLIKNIKISDLDLRWVLGLFVLLGVYLSLTGIAELKGWTWTVFPGYITDSTQIEFLGRARGPLLNPVINGLLVIVGSCAALLLIPHFQKLRIVQVILLIAVGIGLVGAYATLTRSVWLALVIAMAIIAWLPLNQLWRRLTGMMALACIVVLGFMINDGAFQQFKRDKHVTATEMASSANLRTVFLVVAMDMFEDRPILGHGFGQYGKARLNYLSGQHNGVETVKAKDYLQHNILLAYLTEMGLVGVLLLISVLGTFCWVGWVGWLDVSASLAQRQMGLLVFVFCGAYCLNGMFHDVTIIPMANMLLYFLGGLGSNLYSRKFKPKPVLEFEPDHEMIAAGA